MLVPVVFVVLLVVSFGAIAWLTRQTHSEKALEHRVSSLRRTGGDAGARSAEGILKEGAKGAFPGLDEFLGRSRFAAGLKVLIAQAGRRWTLSAFCLYSLAGSLAALLAGYLFFRAAGIAWILAAGGACVPYLFLKRQRGKRLVAFNAGLPDAIDLMARALRAGHSLNSAIEVLSEQAAVPVAVEFQAVFQQQNFGLPLRDALLEMAARVPSKDLRFLVTAMLVQKETGGNLTEILDRAAYVIRDRIRIEGEIRVRTAQGRLTGWILSLLPVILLVLLNLVDPGYSSGLMHNPTGQKLLYAGAGLIAVGTLVIRKIVDIQV